MSKWRDAWEAYLRTAREKSKAISLWQIPFGFCLFLWVCYELYQWHSTGQLDICGRFSGKCQLITHQSAPRTFEFVATINLLGALLFGPVLVLALYCKLTNPN
jgi:hypothetical protein